MGPVEQRRYWRQWDAGRALHSWTSLLTSKLITEYRMRNLQELAGVGGLFFVPLASKLIFIFDSF